PTRVMESHFFSDLASHIFPLCSGGKFSISIESALFVMVFCFSIYGVHRRFFALYVHATLRKRHGLCFEVCFCILCTTVLYTNIYICILQYVYCMYTLRMHIVM